MSRSYFSNIFAASPFAPMQQHMNIATECVALLRDLFEAVIGQQRETVKATYKRIAKLEREADKLKKELRMQLPKGLFIPVARRDLLELLAVQDSLPNTTKDIAGLIVGRKLVLPEALHENYMKYVQRCIDTAQQAKKVIDELDELVETGFRGREVQFVKSIITELDKLEKETDKLEIRIRGQLFKLETALPPVEVMFLYKIIDKTGEVADLAQKVGSRVELLLAK